MYRFLFTFFFIILFLGQAEAYDQQNANPPNASTTAVAEQDEGPTQEGDSESDKAKGQTNEQSAPLVKVNGQEIPVISSADKISKNANVISIIQAIFGFLTLVLAGLATRFAHGAWTAGKEAVRVTREVAGHQSRAYISLSDEPILIYNFTGPDPENEHMIGGGAILYKWKNFSSTPAYEITSGTGFIAVEGEAVPNFSDFSLDENEIFILPPERTILCNPIIKIPMVEFQGWKKNEINIYLLLTIRYKDVFGNFHFLKEIVRPFMDSRGVVQTEPKDYQGSKPYDKKS